MSRSLNDAFIRAYSKDRLAASGRQTGSVPDDGELFIVRIDTATMDIPPPHILNAATRPKNAAQVANGPALQAAAHASFASPPVQASEKLARKIEPSDSSAAQHALIAAQILKSGIWQEQFDAMGGFPTSMDAISDTASFRPDQSNLTSAGRLPVDPQSGAGHFPVAGTPEAAVFNQAANQLSGAGSRRAAGADGPVKSQVPTYMTPGPLPDDSSPDIPSEVTKTAGREPPAERSGPAASNEQPQPTRKRQAQPKAVGKKAISQKPAEQAAHAKQSVESLSGSDLANGSNDARQKSPRETKIRIDATDESKIVQIPEKPREADDQHPVEQRIARELQRPASAALSFEALDQAVTHLAAGRREQGEIFRLDRPSYSAEVNQAATVTPDEPSRVRSESDDVSLLETRTAEPEGAPLEDPALEARNRASRAVEEGLRNAKLRIFNPVWEVDGFQWPVICSELVKRRAENLERVAQNLISACQEGLQVLAVTSPSGGEGRTTVACCLAMLAGSHGLNVAIVDGDIDNPTLSLQTNLDVEQDWKNAIVDQLPLEEVAVHSIDDQVTLLPLLNPIHQDEMSADDNRIAFMLHELSESFDLVIVDMGHMDSSRSLVTSMGEQGMISAVVTVVDLRSSSPQRLEACIRRIRRTGISSIGLVENFAA